jgi:hypothetical protein
MYRYVTDMYVGVGEFRGPRLHRPQHGGFGVNALNSPAWLGFVAPYMSLAACSASGAIANMVPSSSGRVAAAAAAARKAEFIAHLGALHVPALGGSSFGGWKN